MKNPIFRTALTLLLICGVCAGLVAVVYHVTLPVSEAREAEEEKALILSVYPEAASLQEKELEAKGNVEKLTAYLDAEGKLQGFVGIVCGAGFGGDIRLVIAVSPEGKILGAGVQNHSETPGVGSRAVGGDFIAALTGASFPVGENGVDSVSGATISSRAVMAAADELLSLIREEGKA